MYKWSPSTVLYVQRWSVGSEHRWKRSAQMIIWRIYLQNRWHVFPAKKKRKRMSSWANFGWYVIPCEFSRRTLKWYWNRWSNVWFAPTRTSITAISSPKLTYRIDWTAIIWATSSDGSHCVFRNPDFIFIAFTSTSKSSMNHKSKATWQFSSNQMTL